MLPLNYIEIEEQQTQTSKTYYIDFDSKRLVGHCDYLKSIKQAVFVALSTERFEHTSYSWNYGSELYQLFGTSINYAKSEAKRMIKECLLQDDRITDVTDFVFFQEGRSTLKATFLVHTIMGDFEQEVNINV